MTFRLYGKKFRSFRHALGFAAAKSGMKEKYARPTLELVEAHFDTASRKDQVRLAKALSNTIKWQPNRARRILQFVGRHVQESAFTPPADPGTHLPKAGTAVRDHLRDIMLKLVRSGQGRATIRFARSHYVRADEVAKAHIVDALQLVAAYRGLPKRPNPSGWKLPRAVRQQPKEERDGPWFPEHADKIVRMAQRHMPASETPLKEKWIGAGVAAMHWSNTRPALDFVESAYAHADAEMRWAMATMLLIHSSGASAQRVMAIARKLHRIQDGNTPMLMTLVLANVHDGATKLGNTELAEEAERRLNKLGFSRRRPWGPGSG